MDVLGKAKEKTRKQIQNATWVFIISIVLLALGIFMFFERTTGIAETQLPIIFTFFPLMSVVICCHLLYVYKRRRKVLLWAILGKVFLHWKYENGDELVIMERLILRETQIKKGKTKFKFDGLTWGGENFKDALEDLKSGGLPISLILPGFKFSINSNKIPFIIDILSFGHTVEIFLIKDEGFDILHINRADNGTNNATTMMYPVLEEFNFSEENFNELARKIARCNWVVSGVFNIDELEAIEEEIEQD
ncbi:hypothetical protein [Flagellimonas sp. CMM7]|uniref:hypothetical protein n=1 Tax=Flagellimonas sp. CMM7 TaxID=2654676 RepID=UPI0013D22C37|nr:hypothetical protein [Flagellimonas sp. CMM7]UII80138.1 hypothetical protein LV704_01130 [Flagellimonas sp. CMM7]